MTSYRRWLAALVRLGRRSGAGGSLEPRGESLRGRVHKVSIVKGGELSVVLRFGIEELAKHKVDQGSLIELSMVSPPPAKSQE